VINPTRFVCTFWPSHLGILSEHNSPEKSPDTFSSPEPWAYLRDVFTRLPQGLSDEQLLELLPDRWTIAEVRREERNSRS
jgi:hypothetical protein